MKALKPFWIILAALVVVVAAAYISPMFQPKEIIPWRTDFAAAKTEAAGANKQLFLYFTATWCGPCQGLKHTTWADANVEKALSSYVPVKIDIDEHPDLAKQYPSDGIPHFVIASQDGKLVREQIGAMPPAQFLDWLSGKTM